MASQSAPSGGYTMQIDTSQIKRWAAKVDSESSKEIQKFITLALKNSAVIVHHQESKEVPRGVTGKLAKSIKETVTTLAAVIGPDHNLKYAIYVEKGTKPHMPPVDAITEWANKKGINPWALAMSIKQKGTQANPFVERTFKKTKDEVMATWVETTKLIRDFLAEASR